MRAVLTRPDAPVGRKRVLTPSPVKARALELGLDVIEADRLRGEVIARLRSLDVDAVAVVAFGAIAGPAALATARLGWFNLHFSLLPSHRGAAPVQRALIAGETVSGGERLPHRHGHGHRGRACAPAPCRSTSPTPHRRWPPSPRRARTNSSRPSTTSRRGLRPSPRRPSSSPAGRGRAMPRRSPPPTPASTSAVPSPRSSPAPAGSAPPPGPWVEIDGRRTKLFGSPPPPPRPRRPRRDCSARGRPGPCSAPATAGQA